MYLRKNYWNLILVGKWNKHILTPDWVATNLFREQAIEVKFPLSFDAPPIYASTSKKIQFEPSEVRVNFMALEYKNEVLLDIEAMGYTLLETLRYTPMIAFGVNFNFIEQKNTDILKLFRLNDNDMVNELGVEIKETSFTRKIEIEGKTLHLRVANIDQTVEFDFNFHFSVKTANEAMEKLKGSVIPCKELSERIMHQVYNLEYDETEES